MNSIINFIINKDQPSIDIFYEKYAPIVFGLCLKHSLNEKEGEENFIKVFSIILKRIGEAQNTSVSLSTWVIRTTFKECNIPHKLFTNNVRIPFVPDSKL